MKYIKKGKEPYTLKKYRETTSKASYAGFGDKGQLLKKALLQEQGWICAYCMKRINLQRNEFNKPKIEVEHYISQSDSKKINVRELELDFYNMLGVCNGVATIIQVQENTDKTSKSKVLKIEHCDKSKKEKELKKLNPLEKKVETLITYKSNGEILPSEEDIEVTHDIELLNLNNERLIKVRRNAIDRAKELMSKKYPTKTWTKTLIHSEIEIWKSKDKKGRLRPFCQIAIWFWEQQKKRNRYPAK